MQWRPWNRFRREGHPADETLATVWRIQALFNNFRRILEQNNAAIEQMAAMEQALGGAYIFDRAFLEASVHRLSTLVHHVVYNLNALTDNTHVALYERCEQIGRTLRQILAGKPETDQPEVCIPLGAVDWDLEPEVGLAVVCLAEIRRRSEIGVAEGFTVTRTGCLALIRPDLQWPPEALRERLDAAVADLVRKTGTDRLSVSLVSIDALSPSRLPGATCTPADLADTLERLLHRIPADRASIEPAAQPAAALVQAAAALETGEVATMAGDAAGLEVLMVTAHTPETPDAIDRYFLRRAQPFDIVASEIAAKPDDKSLPEGQRPTAAGVFGLLRGSAFLTPGAMKSLARAALVLERLLGEPCLVDWQRTSDGTIVVTGLRSMVPPDPAERKTDLAAALASARICGQGGQTVQSGVAAGTVVHVDERSDPAAFPLGAIAVARSASPRLAPLLQRAGALITEIGTATGHLGIVAREMRVPSVFAQPGALDRLAPGSMVTVDAAAATVYEGILDGLLQSGASGGELFPTDPEYRILRRLLRLILPLNLVDPRAADFTPRGCRSWHDILHYCHEQAVHELTHLQERRPGLAGLRTHRLRTGVPLEIRILDIGQGIAAQAGSEAGVSDLRCQPLAAFLKGLNAPRAWSRDPAALSLKDIASGGPPPAAGGNLAIVTRDYFNLSLQTGYHFSVIDAYQSPDPQRSHIYFRYAGGFADVRRRTRRAGLIHDVLALLDFTVTQKQDLVVGRLKPTDTHSFETVMGVLGALTAFTRQRDTVMTRDADRQILLKRFTEAFLPPAATEGTQ
jgi:pyruvate,water dikinase